MEKFYFLVCNPSINTSMFSQSHLRGFSFALGSFQSYLETRKDTKRHEKSREDTKRHEKTREDTRSHEKTRKDTRRHEKSREVTRRHEKSREDTRKHEKCKLGGFSLNFQILLLPAFKGVFIFYFIFLFFYFFERHSRSFEITWVFKNVIKNSFQLFTIFLSKPCH